VTKNNDEVIKNVYRAIEVVLLLISFIAAHHLRGLGFEQTYYDKIMMLYSIICWYVATKLTNFQRIHYSKINLLFKLVKSILIFIFLITFVGFILKEWYFSRLMYAYYFSIFSFLILILHLIGDHVFISAHKYDKFCKNILVIGAGRMGLAVFKEASYHPEYGMNIVGFLDDNPKGKVLASQVIGKIADLPNILKKKKIHQIIIALPLKYEEEIKRIIHAGDYEGIKIKLIPDLYRITKQNFSIGFFGKIPLMEVNQVPLDNVYNKIMKRSFDIVFSLLVLILGSPIFILAAIAVKLSSPGPILFVQERTGYKQKKFFVKKFRSMRKLPKEIEDKIQATENDPRKTKVGDFIRKTNIDELPQFINVLKGEMSVVGPRPHMLVHTEEFRNKVDEYMLRHFVKPGITGWAQVNGWRGPTDTLLKIEKRVEYDLWYTKNWTFWLDIKIIWLTVFSKQSRLNAF